MDLTYFIVSLKNAGIKAMIYNTYIELYKIGIDSYPIIISIDDIIEYERIKGVPYIVKLILDLLEKNQ